MTLLIQQVNTRTQASTIPWDVLADVLRVVRYRQDSDMYTTILDLFSKGWFYDRTCFIKFSEEVGAPTALLWSYLKRGFDANAGSIPLTQAPPLRKFLRGILARDTLQISDLTERRVEKPYGLHNSQHVITATCSYPASRPGVMHPWREIPWKLFNFDARYFRTIGKVYPNIRPVIAGLDSQPMAVWLDAFEQTPLAVLFEVTPEDDVDD